MLPQDIASIKSRFPRLSSYLDRGFQFTEDWFLPHPPTWLKHVVPHMPNGAPIACMEIGSYEGLSATWIAENMLTHPESTLHCLDHWLGGGTLKGRFIHNLNLTGKGTQVTPMHGKAYASLIQLNYLKHAFDFIYIDGDHQAKAALQDAALCWPMLKQGGIMVFDDYPWQFPEGYQGSSVSPAPLIPPKPGVDAFLELWKGEYELLHTAWQVIIRKL